VDLTTALSSTGTPDATTPWTSSDPTVATVDNDGVVTGVAAGTTDITFLDANGCSSTVEVTVNPNPVITLTPTDPSVCNGTNGSILVGGAGNGTVEWFGDATGTAGPVNLPYTISNLAAGTYDVIFTNATTGCVSNNPTTVLNNPGAPIIDPIDDTTSCAINYVVPNASTYVTGTDLTGGQAFYSAPGGNVANLLATGTTITAAMSPMTIYVYDANGACESEISFVVTIHTNPTAAISPNPAAVCADLDLQLNGNPTGGSGTYATHAWTNTGAASLDDASVVDPLFSNAAAGTYDLTYTVTDDNGCVGSTNITVTVFENPIAAILPDPAVVCAGEELQLNGNPSNGSGTYTSHVWTNTGAASLDNVNVVNPNFTNGVADAYDLTYTVTDNNGCVGTANTTVVVNENPTAAISPDPAEVCAAVNLQLNGNPAGGSGVYTTHAWSNTGAAFLNATAIEDPVFNNSGADTYDLTYTVTDDNGCVGSTDITVTVFANPTASILPAPAAVCAGDDLQLNGNPTGGSGTYATHAWTNTGAASLDDASVVDPLFSNAAAGPYDLTYTVTDDNGCIATANTTVTVVASPIIDPLGPIEACDSYDLPAITGVDLTGNQAYFNDTQANGGSVVTGPITASTTLYMYDGASGCSDEVMVVITINDLPTVTAITGDGQYCEDETPVDVLVTVTGSADWTLEYTLDGVTQTVTGSASPINLGNAGGVYELVGISDDNCTNTASGSVEIVLLPTPLAPSVSEDAEYCSSVTFAPMTANGSGGTLTWYTNDALTDVYQTGGSASPANIVGATTYYIKETLSGCEGPFSEITITIENCEIIVATAITPDGDGNNDRWIIPNLDEAYPNAIVRIYNRWGSVIFEHDSSAAGNYNDNAWDGTYQGKALPVGSYFYVIELNDENQEKVNGAVSIILN
jgi:gliding motility-associated-like protein